MKVSCLCKNECEIQTLAKIESTYVRDALIHFLGNRMATARALKISIRTLRNKIAKNREFFNAEQTILSGQRAVICASCSAHCSVSTLDYQRNIEKIFFCSKNCKAEYDVSVVCSWCEKMFTISWQQYCAKQNKRFFCEENCVKLWNKNGDPKRVRNENPVA